MSKRLSNHDRILRAIPEADWQSTVIAHAHMRGWKVYATKQSGKTLADGTYVTIIEADGKGFPDLVAVHPERRLLIFIENKRETEHPTPEQDAWGDWLAAVPGVRCWVLRPSDADDLDQVFGEPDRSSLMLKGAR